MGSLPHFCAWLVYPFGETLPWFQAPKPCTSLDQQNLNSMTQHEGPNISSLAWAPLRSLCVQASLKKHVHNRNSNFDASRLRHGDLGVLARSIRDNKLGPSHGLRILSLKISNSKHWVIDVGQHRLPLPSWWTYIFHTHKMHEMISRIDVARSEENGIFSLLTILWWLDMSCKLFVSVSPNMGGATKSAKSDANSDLKLPPLQQTPKSLGNCFVCWIMWWICT